MCVGGQARLGQADSFASGPQDGSFFGVNLTQSFRCLLYWGKRERAEKAVVKIKPQDSIGRTYTMRSCTGS